MFKPGQNLTNVRPPKSETPEITVTPTPGSIKINQPATIALGLRIDDYVGVNIGEEIDQDGNETGRKVYAVFKGVAPVISKDDTTGKEVVVTQANGAKLSVASAKASSGNLQFSSANVWQQLGGNQEKRKVYGINLENSVEESGITYYEMFLLREEDKMERNTKDKDESEDASEQNA